MSQFSFPQEEKLKSTKTISRLFGEGQSVFAHPVKFVYLPATDSDTPGIKIAVSVSGKKFKKATDRNLIKRRLRETFRLNKAELRDKLLANNLLLVGMFIYVGTDICQYETFSAAVQRILSRLSNDITGKLSRPEE